MRKIYSSLLALVLLMGGVTAKAQFTAEVTADPGGFEPMALATCSLSEVAEALGTDAATFAAEFAKGHDGCAILVELDQGEAGMSTDYTQGGYGNFWMSTDGRALSWGNEELAFYNITSCDTENDLLIFGLGQYPNYFQGVGGEKGVAKFVFTLGEKKADVTVTLHINKLLDFTFTKEYASLNILDTKTVDVHVTNGKIGTATADISALLEKIAAEKEEVAKVLDKMTGVISVGEEDGYPADTLVQLSKEGWIGLNVDEVKKAAYASGTNAYTAFELYSPAFDEEGNYTIVVDLTEKAMANGTTMPADLYVVYNSDAVLIKLNVVADEPVLVALDDMTKVGEEVVINIEGTSKPSDGSFSIDINAIAELLGCTPAELSFNAVDETGEALSDLHTANNGGIWMTTAGVPITWGVAGFAIYVEPRTAGDLSFFNYGFNSSAWTAGTTADFDLYLSNEDKYYALKVHVVMKEKEVDPGFEYKSVATLYAPIQLVPAASDWERQDNVGTLDLNAVAEALGTSDYVVYTDYYQAGAEDEEGEMVWTSDNTLDDASAFARFWYLREKHNGYTSTSPWGENADWSFGVALKSDGYFNIYQRQSNVVGDTYRANLYFVDETTGNYVTYELNVSFVSEVGPQAEVVLVKEDAFEFTDGVYYIDTEAIMAAFGMTEKEELESVEVLFAQPGGIYMASEGEAINAEGYVMVDYSTEEPLPYGSATVDIDRTEWSVLYDPQDPDEEGIFEAGDDSKGIIRLAFDYDGKRVLYTITVVSEGVLSAIGAPATATEADGLRYNLAGQRVDAAYKGIVIENGRKVLVK